MMRKKDQQPKGKEEKVHSLQNQFFHILLGPMGLGETLTIFFCVLGRDGKSNERHKKKSKHNQGKESNKKQMMKKKEQQPKGKEEKVHSLQNQFFHILLGPMGLGETLAFFFCVLGCDGKSNEWHRKRTRASTIKEKKAIKNKWWGKSKKNNQKARKKKQEQKYIQKKTKKQIKTYSILKDVCKLYFKMYVIMQWTISLPKMCNQAARMTGPRRRHPAWHLASQNTKALPKTLDTATFFDTTTSGTHICHQAPLILEVQTQKVIATTILVPLRRVSSTLRSTIC